MTVEQQIRVKSVKMLMEDAATVVGPDTLHQLLFVIVMKLGTIASKLGDVARKPPFS